MFEKIYKKQGITSRRSESNLRFNHNLTQLPSYLLKFLTLNGEELDESDLCNSQFALLSHLIQNDKIITEMGYKTPFVLMGKDFTLFKKLTSEGGLYQYIMDKMEYKEKEQAKSIMMMVTFSCYTYKCVEKDVFKCFFPSVAEWVYKFIKANSPIKKNQDRTKGSLPLMLQKFESMIFIDSIYGRLKEEGITAYSKHDSILCAKSDTKRVRQIMTEELNKLNVGHTIDVKGEEKELKQAKEILNEIYESSPVIEDCYEEEDEYEMWVDEEFELWE